MPFQLHYMSEQNFQASLNVCKGVYGDKFCECRDQESLQWEDRPYYQGSSQIITELIVQRKMKKKYDMGKPLLRKKTSVRVRVHTGEKL